MAVTAKSPKAVRASIGSALQPDPRSRRKLVLRKIHEIDANAVRLQRAAHARAGADDEHPRLTLLRLGREARQRMGRRGVGERNAGQIENEGFRPGANCVEHGRDGGRDAEEERSVYAIGHDLVGAPRRHVAVPAVVSFGEVELDGAAARLDLDDLGHAMHEEQRAERYAGADPNRDVVKDGQEKGRREHEGLAAIVLEDRDDLLALDHVPATMVSTAASVAGGMCEASGAATAMKTSRNSACRMPAAGPCAPARIFVAVRAIAPVQHRPPKRAEPMLAKPCAASSQFERWRRPVMPSATTAESSDSMPPRSAMAMAEGRSSRSWRGATCGREGAGSPSVCRRISSRSSRPEDRGPRRRGRRARSP